MANQKPKKQIRDQDRLQRVLKECGPILIPFGLWEMFQEIPGDIFYCHEDDIALTKSALQCMLEDGRAKMTTENGFLQISAVE